ncbi:hypothetical protein PTW37_01955 [Arthrobacter agilis]|uniref:hypothetical protein n=1 Tax=Arthrobacter agilis TaxID=37921 RepID=UPI0023659B91|nr:hypothetical protein [Arthrobacter agilis]WDF33718.1 hypothetical protein PTW37_01955 [Arthrobacter agilis]
MNEWPYNDPSIADEDKLYRRMPHQPGCRTYDAMTDRWVPHPGGLRRLDHEGMSTHLHSILEERQRDCASLYNGEKYGSIRFPVAVPRSAGAGVLPTAAPQEEDPDLKAAHAEVRPPSAELDKRFWKGVVNMIAREAEWVQPPILGEHDRLTTSSANGH